MESCIGTWTHCSFQTSFRTAEKPKESATYKRGERFLDLLKNTILLIDLLRHSQKDCQENILLCSKLSEGTDIQMSVEWSADVYFQGLLWSWWTIYSWIFGRMYKHKQRWQSYFDMHQLLGAATHCVYLKDTNIYDTNTSKNAKVSLIYFKQFKLICCFRSGWASIPLAKKKF